MSGREHSAELLSDQSRVIARLFLPGEGVSSTHSRAAEIVARALAIPADVIESMAATLLADFSTRHTGVSSRFDDNAQAVKSRDRLRDFGDGIAAYRAGSRVYRRVCDRGSGAL